jgi:hypothetical protein
VELYRWIEVGFQGRWPIDAESDQLRNAVISARIGDEQSLGICSILDGLAFLLMLGHKAPPWAGTLQIEGRDARAQYASLRSPAR